MNMPANEDTWYQELRSAWRPHDVKLLLIGESAPATRGPNDERRFFYAPVLSRADNLFRSVVAALYDAPRLTAGSGKAPWLERFRDDGVWLIDLVPFPVNGMPSGSRRRALRDHVSGCVDQVKSISPSGIVICHGPTFEVLAPALRAAGLPLLHDVRIPFPLGNTRAEFIAKFRSAVSPRQ